MSDGKPPTQAAPSVTVAAATAAGEVWRIRFGPDPTGEFHLVLLISLPSSPPKKDTAAAVPVKRPASSPLRHARHRAQVL